MKKQTKTELVALAALISAAGVATYTFIRTYRSVKSLDKLDLDFSNDPVLSSIFKKD